MLPGFGREGDTVVVQIIDRMACSLDDQCGLMQGLTDRGVRLEFVKERMAFTEEYSPMAPLMLSVMGTLAEFERSLIRERRREGIAPARLRGVYRCRRRGLSSAQAHDLRPRAGDE